MALHTVMEVVPVMQWPDERFQRPTTMASLEACFHNPVPGITDAGW